MYKRQAYNLDVTGTIRATSNVWLTSGSFLSFGTGGSLRLWDDGVISHLVTNDDSNRDLAINTGWGMHVLLDGGIDLNTNDSTGDSLTNSGLRFGSGGSGEGINSVRDIAYDNAFGLDFYTDFLRRMSLTTSGWLGVGTVLPDGKLDVFTDYNPIYADGSYIDVKVASTSGRGLNVDYNDPNNNINNHALSVTSNSESSTVQFTHNVANNSTLLDLYQYSDGGLIYGISSGVTGSILDFESYNLAGGNYLRMYNFGQFFFWGWDSYGFCKWFGLIYW